MENQPTKPAKKIKIDTLIVSDIHLGDDTTRCEELMMLLRKYDYKRLILNGDILNGLRFKRLHTAHWKILSKFRNLAKTCEVIWVHGNHDAQSYILSQLLGIKVSNRYVWKEDGKKFLAIHGHQYDRFLNNNFIVSRLAFGAYHLIKTYDHNGLLTGLIKEKSVTWQRSSEEVARGALRLGWLMGADYVFCGHTHKIHTAENKGVKYFNDGSWNEKPSGFITITNGEVALDQVG